MGFKKQQRQKHTVTTSPEKILFLTVPLTVAKSPLMAGAVLKPIAEKLGYKFTVIDFNQVTLQWLRGLPVTVELADYFWSQSHDPLATLTKTSKSYVTEWINKLSQLITDHAPSILALSLLTDSSRTAANLIIPHVRRYFPQVKIILGGSGINNDGYALFLKQDKMIDHYIIGDAEHSFQEFLQNNLTFPGINSDSWQLLTNSSQETLPDPDYSDVDWSLYSRRTIGITGSRGCVRKCTFCDYIVTHPKFTWRSGQNIFDEMVRQQAATGISSFEFSDSLLNGNMQAFRELITLLSDYNQQNPHNTIDYLAYFILRTKEQFKEELWRLTAASGGTRLIVGIETFSDDVRADLGKKFTNNDIDFAIAMAMKYNIHLQILTFVGYITETEKHIDNAIEWLDQHQYAKSHVTITIGTPMAILKNSWIDQNIEQLGIKFENNDRQLWYNKQSSFDQRSAWHQRILDHVKKLKYKYISDSTYHWLLANDIDGVIDSEY
jgi:radical SAM superfamily enzyme YgiQ (UPF0313 family)